MLSGSGRRAATGAGRSSATPHVALLGDSVFDNGAYTGGEPDVLGHLRSLLPARWRSTLLAVDGSRIRDLGRQLRRVPADVTHLVISVGGNDALDHSDLLGLPVASTAEALELFGRRAESFEAAYRQEVDAALALGRPATLCTVYNGDLGEPEASLARVALRIFNDALLRVAFERGLPVIDLRLVCTEPADFAYRIEPSGRGGRKIAQAVAQALGVGEDEPASRVYPG